MVQLLLDLPDLEAPLGDGGAPPRWRAGRRPEWEDLRRAPLWGLRRWRWLRSLLGGPLPPATVEEMREDLRDLEAQMGESPGWSSGEED